MADLISRAAAIEEIARRDTTNGTVKVYSGLEVNAILGDLPAVSAVPVEWLMKYAQLPTEFAIAAWRKQDKDAQEKRIKRLDKPMSFDDALNLVNDVFPLGQKEQETDIAEKLGIEPKEGV